MAREATETTISAARGAADRVDTLDHNGFGLNTRELARFVKLGMTHEQPLQAAAAAPAEMFWLEKSLGSK